MEKWAKTGFCAVCIAAALVWAAYTLGALRDWEWERAAGECQEEARPW